MRVIAFCGPKGCGKDTAAKRLFVRGPNFVHVNFAGPMKSGVQAMFGFSTSELEDPNKKESELTRWPYLIPRAVMQDIANYVRDKYGPDFWAMRWLGYIGDLARKHPNQEKLVVVCTDLRFPAEELSAILSVNGHIAYVDNDKVEMARYRGLEAKDPLWCNASEAHAETLRTHTIHNMDGHFIRNNGTLDELYQEVDKAFPFETWP